MDPDWQRGGALGWQLVAEPSGRCLLSQGPPGTLKGSSGVVHLPLLPVLGQRGVRGGWAQIVGGLTILVLVVEAAASFVLRRIPIGVLGKRVEDVGARGSTA